MRETNETKWLYVCDHGVKGMHPFVHLIGPQTLGAMAQVSMGSVCHPAKIE